LWQAKKLITNEMLWKKIFLLGMIKQIPVQYDTPNHIFSDFYAMF
jgi:hypothetical protein